MAHEGWVLGLGFGEQNAGGSFLHRGDLVGVGYTAFEAVGECHWVRCKGALVGAKNPKPSCRGSVLVNETWGEGAFG